MSNNSALKIDNTWYLIEFVSEYRLFSALWRDIWRRKNKLLAR